MKKKQTLDIDGREIAISNPDKVLYPAAGYTKGQVIDYYIRVADHLLPHLKDRPVTLKRYPDGITGEHFYEKDAPAYTPDWVRTFPVPRRAGGTIDYILMEDLATLVWCANLANLEIHPFLHRVPDIERPTHVVFDLDPGEGTDVLTCAEIAFLVKELLDRLDLQSFAKVSGSKGIQIHVPLNTAVTYDLTQPFARTLAELLAQQHPDRIVSEMAKERRKGKVFIDWSQNADHKTTVGVYSLRAKRSHPFVSMPVKWEELKKARKEETLFFDPEAALKRLAKTGDLFAPVLTLKQELPSEVLRALAAGVRAPSQLELDRYRVKRDFSKTAEPAPLPRASRQGGRRRFVVQKHAASHLHYDFRLEMHGVLKSWAVPKGPPYKLDERRLAMATEDHPIEYLDFEGTIPKGQYGGGTVMVWDIGTYELVEGNYYKGRVQIFLEGKKLKGEWLLERDAENKWRFIKTGKSVRPVKDDTSAITGRTMEQIATAADAVWQSNRPMGAGAAPQAQPARRTAASRARKKPAAPASKSVPKKVSSAKTRPRAKRSTATAARNAEEAPRADGPAAAQASRPPVFVTPMRAKLAAALPDGPGWQYEIKFDGYRALALKTGGEVRLLSRNDLPLNSRFPAIASALEPLPEGTMLDGEIVALDAEGRPSFNILQNSRSAKLPVVYYVFDLLHDRGRSLVDEPLSRRRAALTSVLAGIQEQVRLSQALEADPADLIAAVREQGLEGIIAKRFNSRYEPGERSGAWLKYKVNRSQELVIGGYKPGRNLFDYLLVGYYEAGKLLFIGKIKNGFVPHIKHELLSRFQPLVTDRCPFANLPEPPNARRGEAITAEVMKRIQWLRPELVAQVEFTEWTAANHLRHARFAGLRDDKDPRDVTHEIAA